MVVRVYPMAEWDGVCDCLPSNVAVCTVTHHIIVHMYLTLHGNCSIGFALSLGLTYQHV